MAKIIPLRYSDQKWAEYSEKAQAKGLGLSTYLKQRVDESEQVHDHLAGIRQDIAGINQDRPHPIEISDAQPVVAGLDQALLIEAVLLLRSVVGADKQAVVHAELERQGLRKWTPAT